MRPRAAEKPRNPLFLVTLAAALVVGAVLSPVVESWWLLGAAVGAHALLTLAIVAITLLTDLVGDGQAIEDQVSPHDLPPGDPARRALEERRDGG